MEDATTPSGLAANAHAHDATADDPGNEIAISLLREALVLLDLNRQYGAAARVSSALDHLGDAPSSEDAVLAWLDACDAREACHQAIGQTATA